MSWDDMISRAKPIIDPLVNNPPKCPMCNHDMTVLQVREVNKQMGTRVVLWEADLICPFCGYERTVRIGYDVKRDLKIGRFISLLPYDLRSDPNLYHELLCIEIGKYKICESYGILYFYEEDKLLLVTADLEDIKYILQLKLPWLRVIE